MIVVMKEDAAERSVEAVSVYLERHGYDARRFDGAPALVLGLTRQPIDLDVQSIEALPEVDRALRLPTRGNQAPLDTIGVQIGSAVIGNGSFAVISGARTADAHSPDLGSFVNSLRITDAPIVFFRASRAPEPLGPRALAPVQAAREAGAAAILEVLDSEHLAHSADSADCVLITSGDSLSPSLIRSSAACGRPVILRRGSASTVEEWLLSADTLLNAGLTGLILCEAGIRTFDPKARASLDVSAIPVLKELTRLPVIADPGATSSKPSITIPLARAAAAAGADGVIMDISHATDMRSAIELLRSLHAASRSNDVQQCPARS